jgi:integrase
MSIHKTKQGTYQVRWRDQNGRLCSKNFRRKQEADVWNDQMKALKRAGERTDQEILKPQTHAEITFEAFSTLWLETYAKAHKTASSVMQDEAIIRLHFLPRWSQTDIENISRFDVTHLQAELKEMLADAKDWQLLKTNVCEGLKPIRSQKAEITFWTKDEKVRFLNHCRSRHPRLYEVVTLAVSTGMRRGEIAGLKRDCLDFEKRQLLIKRSYDCHMRRVNEHTKGKKSRRVPMTKEVFDILKNYRLLAPDQLVYGPSIESLILKNFKKVCKEAQVSRIRFHDLRHTFASHLAMSGLPMFDLSKLLGHSTVAMTEKYAHLCPDHLQRVTEMIEERGVHEKFTRSEGVSVSV